LFREAEWRSLLCGGWHQGLVVLRALDKSS
jgi:hypothetical protein